jgi:hypothetical protein
VSRYWQEELGTDQREYEFGPYAGSVVRISSGDTRGWVLGGVGGGWWLTRPWGVGGSYSALSTVRFAAGDGDGVLVVFLLLLFVCLRVLPLV